MKLEEALNKIGGPTRGVTSVIAGLMSGDVAPISGDKRVTESLTQAREKLENIRTAQRECNSDWAWWAYQGDISYWETVVSLLEAAEIVGPDNLPDVPFDNSAGVVMDICARQERFGKEVLRLSRDHIPLT
jgi:hypothetical protein